MSRSLALVVGVLLVGTATGLPIPKPKEVGPVEIDFSPLDGQKAPDFGFLVKVEQNGKQVYAQTFDVNGPAQTDDMCRAVSDTLSRADFEVEIRGGGKLAVTKFKKGEQFTLRVEVTGLPKGAPIPKVRRIEHDR